MKNSIENRFIWLNGKIMHVNDAKINVLSPTSQFGANVFEGIRCYWNDEKQQLYAFRLKEHYERLQQSIKLFKMDSPYTEDELIHYLKDVVRAEEYKQDIAVRQTIFLDGYGTWSSSENVGMFIAPIPKNRRKFSLNNALTCKISSWRRISDLDISPRAKVGANYINSRMAQLEAKDCGFDSALFMNGSGKMSEGPGSCLFIVRDGVLYTPPVTASILDSITRKTIIELAQEELKITVVERDIDRTEMYICDEAFLCGSAMEINPIVNVDGYAISGNFEITRKIFELYIRVVSGMEEKYMHWLTKIYN
jgi:branched-chain-amino-acid transaminase